MKTLLIVSILSMTACGGGGSKPAKPEPVETTPTPTEATPMAQPEAQPVETKPAEPPPPPAPDPKVVAMEAETAAFAKAKPVFDKSCMGCHGKGRGATKKALAELDINQYPFKGKHGNAADIRKVLGIGGGKATMPKNKPGSVKGDDLAAIAAWADAWDAAETAGAHAAAGEPKPEPAK